MAHWRETYKPARFFTLDARAGVPLIGVCLHARVWTVGLAVTVLIVFYVLERRGLTLPAALRGLRAWIIGDRRPALPIHHVRHTIDYERRFTNA